MERNKQVSLEGTKVWIQGSPEYDYNYHYNHQQQQNQKVPVVYYLSRKGQLEHPHLMEVPLSSSSGLYLRDVIERLKVLRGRGMASMYSWSFKRSYKNGYVWHGLCDDDLIIPAHGNEYVLKGSELFEESDFGQFSPVGAIILQNQKALPEPPFTRNQESSCSSNLNCRTIRSFEDDELCPQIQHPYSLVMSPESGVVKNSSWDGSLSLTKYKVYKNDVLADASTQTKEKARRDIAPRDNCSRGVSTDEGTPAPDSNGARPNQVSRVTWTPEIFREFVSPPPSAISPPSSGRTDTLESLVRDDVWKLNNFKTLEEEGFQEASNPKLKASNKIMQLISCGLISAKDHIFSLIPTYKPRLSYTRFPFSFFSTSLMLGEIDCLAESPRLMGTRLKDKQYFGRSLAETRMPCEDAPTLRPSSSFDAGSTQQLNSVEDKEEESSKTSKCIPLSIKASLSEQPRCESMRSTLSTGPRISSEGVANLQAITTGVSNGGRKRTTEHLSGNDQSRKPDYYKNDKENVIKIEERLASGARVIIKSKVSADNGA